MSKRTVNLNGSPDSRLPAAALHFVSMPPERFDWSDRRPPQASPSPAGLAPAGLAEAAPAAGGPASPSAPPDLEVRTRRSVHQLTAGTTYQIGRDPKSDIVMTDSRVSWRHGEMRAEADGWVIEDLGSTNGTFLGAQRLDRIDIREECVVRLGNPDDGPVLRCVPQVAASAAPPAAAPPLDHPGTALSMPAAPAPAAPEAEPEPAPRPDSESWWQPAQEPEAAPRDYAPRHGSGAPPQPVQPAAAVQAEMLPSVDRRPTSRMPLPAKAMRIGRVPDNDVVLSDLNVSRHHAELRKSPTGQYEIVDLGSHNGTFVNGQRVTKQVLTEQDLVSIGSSTFRLTGGELQAVRRRRQHHLHRPGTSGQGRQQGAAGPCELPDPGKVPARRHRPQRRGQVHPARRADRDAPRDHRHGAVRQPRPVPELQRAQVPDRPGPAGERAAHPADRAARAAVLGRAQVPRGRQASRTRRPGRRGDGRAGPDQARQHPRRPAVRRPAQAGQRGAGTADQAVAAVPGRADLGPGPWPGQVGHGADARPGPRRPDGHRRHPQRGQPGHLRPAARPGPGRADRLLRPARGRALLLRPGPLGRGVPGLRPVSGPRLGRRVRRLARLRPVRAGPAVAAAAGAGGPGTGGHPAAAAARRVQPDGHADPAVRAGDRLRPRLPDVHDPAAHPPRRADLPGAGHFWPGGRATQKRRTRGPCC